MKGAFDDLASANRYKKRYMKAIEAELSEIKKKKSVVLWQLKTCLKTVLSTAFPTIQRLLMLLYLSQRLLLKGVSPK